MHKIIMPEGFMCGDKKVFRFDLEIWINIVKFAEINKYFKI